MDKNRVLRNAVVAASQSVVTGITLFFLYRYLLQSIGAEDLGVWALVLATTSAASLANLGIATSTTKFVSQYLARDNPSGAGLIIQTAALSVAILLSIVLPLVYPVLALLLDFLVQPAGKIDEALLILPFALVSFWLNSVSGVFQACIDGFQRVDIRGYLLMIASVIYLLVVFWLVPINGLVGLAQAQVIQAGLLLASSWLILLRLMPALPALPFRWTYAAFKEILGYSLNVQVISITQLLLEPVTKSLMSRFGGVGLLAYFEMAHRMVFQLRALIAAGHQAIVPTIADLQERDRTRLRGIYKHSFQLLLFLVIVGLPFCIILTPHISMLWIGSYNTSFILFAQLVFIGWFLNLLANPAYFANLGTGDLRWNVIGHFAIGILNPILGILLGYRFGAVGITIGFVISICTGSAIIVLAYHKKNRVTLKSLVERRSMFLGISSFGAMLLASYLFRQFSESFRSIVLASISVGLFFLITVWPAWRHPALIHIRSLLRRMSTGASNRSVPPASS